MKLKNHLGKKNIISTLWICLINWSSQANHESFRFGMTRHRVWWGTNRHHFRCGWTFLRWWCSNQWTIWRVYSQWWKYNIFRQVRKCIVNWLTDIRNNTCICRGVFFKPSPLRFGLLRGKAISNDASCCLRWVDVAVRCRVAFSIPRHFQ